MQTITGEMANLTILYVYVVKQFLLNIQQLFTRLLRPTQTICKQ